MHTKIFALALAVSVLLLGCGPGKKGCQWWDTECPDSPYGVTTATTTSAASTTDVASCIEACDGDLTCEEECVDP